MKNDIQYEQASLFDFVERNDSRSHQPVENRPAEPSHPCRSMGPDNSMYGQILATSSEPNSTIQEKIPRRTTADMAGFRKKSGLQYKCSKQESGSRHLESLDSFSIPSQMQIHLENDTASSSKYRSVDLVHLLNSTSLGNVISERQLRRHKGKSKQCFLIDGKVDFVRYLAWLIDFRYRCNEVPTTGKITQKKVLALLDNQQYRCALSGRILTPKNASLDHILPVSRGGPHLIENAQVLDKQVNRAKGTLINDEFIQLCRDVIEWTNNHNQKAIRSNRRSVK